jgi:hypothetical protein
VAPTIASLRSPPANGPPPGEGTSEAGRRRACRSSSTRRAGAAGVAPPPSRPIARWTYRNLTGQVLGYVSRFDLPDGGKVFLPLTLWRSVRGLRWFWKALPVPRPLYGLDQLTARPEAPVLICRAKERPMRHNKSLPVTWLSPPKEAQRRRARPTGKP